MRRLGSTLVELMIVVSIMGILSAIAIPSFQRAVEQSRVDQAAAALRTVWAAQRFYKLDHGTYAGGADALRTLRDEGLIAELDTSSFTYTIGESGFPVTAERRGSSAWSGTLEIAEGGALSGQVVGDDRVIKPAFVFGGG